MSCFAGRGAGFAAGAVCACTVTVKAAHKAIKSNRLRTLSPYHRERRPAKETVCTGGPARGAHYIEQMQGCAAATRLLNQDIDCLREKTRPAGRGRVTPFFGRPARGGP